jgi:dihydroflavonol-4-reductase
MKILLTGATGFLGSRVTELLASEGHEIVGLRRPQSRTEHIARFVARWIQGSVTDPLVLARAADGMDAIVHMAADLSHWHRYRERIFHTNVTGTRVVAEAAKTAGVPALVHVSSVAAVGFAPDSAPIDETAPNNFAPMRMVYHESKRLAEEEALDAIRYGVKVVIANPGVLYGPRDLSHTFGHTMLELAKGRIPGHPSGGVSVTDVDDAAAGIVAALHRGRSGERYLLTGHNLQYGEIFAAQARIIGVPYRGREIPTPVLHLAARAFELQSAFTHKEPRLTIDNAKIAPLKMWYDCAKAMRELQYNYRPLEQTLERMARAYRTHHLLP